MDFVYIYHIINFFQIFVLSQSTEILINPNFKNKKNKDENSLE